MSDFHRVLSVTKTWLPMLALCPLWPVIGLMWLMKWATPDDSPSSDTDQPTIQTARIAIESSEECPWCGRVSLRRTPFVSARRSRERQPESRPVTHNPIPLARFL